MSTSAEQLLEAHPQAGPAWYLAVAHITGRVLTIPGLRRWQPLARRVHAISQSAGQVTMLSEPGGNQPQASRQLTVLSANLWHDWPRHRRWSERLEAFAQLAETVEADVLLLQEVARTPGLRADGWLAERLGFAMTFARANGDLGAIGFEEGPAILSRFALADVHLHQLSHGHNPLARRVALAAHAETPFGRLLVVSTHLGLIQRHNAGQIRRLRSWVAEVSAGSTAIIGGDFNAPEHRTEIAQTRRTWTDTFSHVHPHAKGITHTRRLLWGRPLHRRLDYIFIQQPTSNNWDVVESSHLDAPGGPHSDHRAVLARLGPPTDF